MKAMQIQSTKQLQEQAQKDEKARSKLAADMEAEKAAEKKVDQDYQKQVAHLKDESAKSLMQVASLAGDEKSAEKKSLS